MKYYHCRIGNFVNIRQGFAINKNTKHHMSDSPTNLHLLRIGDMKDGSFSVYVKDTIPENFIAHENDIIYTRTGQVGLVFTNQNGVVHNNCFTVTSKDENVLYRMFLFYALQTERFYYEANSRASGAAQPDLSHGAFCSIEIPVPPIHAQKRIASILSAYDNLIENNQKQIKLLEEAAQRLYQEWFVKLRFPGYEKVKVVDGVPEGWKRQSMNDIADYLNGYAFKPSDWGEIGKPIIKIKELNEGITQNTPRNTGENVPEKYIIRAGDILFSWSATLTAMIWDNEDGLLNQHLFKVTPNRGIDREFMLQSILYTLEQFKNLTTGATMKHIQRGKLKDVYVLVPDSELMKNYSKMVETIRTQILKKRHCEIILTEARDRLLPKLMSGEIEV